MLPLPLLLPIALLVGASGFRLRGDAVFALWTGRGATTARLVCWALPMGVLAWIAGHDAVSAGLIGIGMYLGCLAPWWRSLTLGRDASDGGALGQYARHAARGLIWTAPAAIMLAAMRDGGAIPLFLSGMACVPAYELGWRLRPMGSTAKPRATEIGEGLFGAAMAAGVAVAA